VRVGLGLAGFVEEGGNPQKQTKKNQTQTPPKTKKPGSQEDGAVPKGVRLWVARSIAWGDLCTPCTLGEKLESHRRFLARWDRSPKHHQLEKRRMGGQASRVWDRNFSEISEEKGTSVGGRGRLSADRILSYAGGLGWRCISVDAVEVQIKGGGAHKERFGTKWYSRRGEMFIVVWMKRDIICGWGWGGGVGEGGGGVT